MAQDQDHDTFVAHIVIENTRDAVKNNIDINLAVAHVSNQLEQYGGSSVDINFEEGLVYLNFQFLNEETMLEAIETLHESLEYDRSLRTVLEKTSPNEVKTIASSYFYIEGFPIYSA